MDVMDLRRGLIAQMAKKTSIYELITSVEMNVNTDSTSAMELTRIQLPERCYTSEKILYIKVRDKAGARAGYFLGSDTFITNTFPANGNTNPFGSGAYYVTKVYKCNDTGLYEVRDIVIGIYPANISANGLLVMNVRYNATYTGVINGAITIDVYLLDWPDNISPFSA